MESPVPFCPGCAVVRSTVLIIAEIPVAAGCRTMNGNTAGEGKAFCVDGIAPEVDIRQTASGKGIIINNSYGIGNDQAHHRLIVIKCILVNDIDSIWDDTVSKD